MPRCQEIQFANEADGLAACQQRADAQSGIVQSFETWARVVVPDAGSGGFTILIARWPLLSQRRPLPMKNGEIKRNAKPKSKP